MKKLSSLAGGAFAAFAAWVAAVSLGTLAVSTAQADVLLYDGFDLANGYVAAGLKAKPTNNYRSSQTGFSGTAWSVWNDTSVVYVHDSGSGLTYPSMFWDDFTAVDSSIGFNNSANDGGNRTLYRTFSLATALKDCQKVYFRVLVNCNGDASKLTDKAVYGMGLCNANPAVNGLTDTFGSTGLWLGFRYTTSGSLKAVLDILGTRYELGAMSQETTYVMVAEISVGTGTDGADEVRAFAVPIDSFTPGTEYWSSAVGTAGTAEAVLVKNASTQLQHLIINGNYGTQDQLIAFDEVYVGTTLGDVVPVPTGKPVLGDVTLSRTGTATYTVTAEELLAAADTIYWIANDGTVVTTNSFASNIAAGTTATGTDVIAGLAANKTWQISVLAENNVGTAEKAAGVIYTGNLSLGATTDANETGLVPGGVVVSRAAADPWPLTVNYTISGTAGSEGATWVAPTPVTIPAGSASATLPVVPLLDQSVTQDVTITVTLDAGNYEIPSTASAALTLFNVVAPAGKKTWVAPADGLASDGANWLPAGAPTSSDEILFDGQYSSANCYWDAVTPSVTSWTQAANYAGTVEIQTTYSNGAFPLFSIANDCTVNGGKWTHASNTNVADKTAAEYRLNVAIGGDFTLGVGAKIDLIGRGYNVGRCPAGSEVGVHAATARGTYSAIYGNVLAPEDIGSGGESGGQYGPNISSGGGAVKLVVTGSAVVDGTIAANAQKQYVSGNPEKGHGAGGSVFITASSISGSGTVDVSARPAGISEIAYTGYAGSGGRMALVATSGEVTIPMANLLANGSYGSYSAGAGTIYIKNATDTNGSLLVGTSVADWNFSVRYVRKDGCTCVKPGETWTFDHIYVRDRGILSVPEGATLSLPGGFESVSSLTDNSTPLCGILYLGGTITLPVRQEHVLSGPWMFMAAEPFTFQGDVRLTSKASIGSFQLYADSVAAYPACTVRVTGDMTVESGATLYANNRGRRGADAKSQGYHGGSVAVTTHHLNVYDSIFSPNLGGTGGRSDDMGKTCPGGGAIVLTVVGQLTMNGNANAGSTDISANSHLGAAGTINITAGSLVGSGNITANGGSSSSAKSRGAGGGGRVSVRLTDAGATFAGFTGTIKAEGNNGNTSTTTAGSSAGTVYLQDGNTAEGAGIIKVANIANSTAVDAKTGFPSLANNAPIDDLTKATLEVSNNSKVIFIADVKMGGLELASGSSIDLAGKKVTVKRAKLAGTSLAPKTYAAGDAAVSGFVSDSGVGGELVVSGIGLTFTIR